MRDAAAPLPASDEDQARAYDAMTAAQRAFQTTPTPGCMADVLAKTRLYLAAAGFTEEAVEDAARAAQIGMLAFQKSGAPLPQLGRVISNQEPREAAE